MYTVGYSNGKIGKIAEKNNYPSKKKQDTSFKKFLTGKNVQMPMRINVTSAILVLSS